MKIPMPAIDPQPTRSKTRLILLASALAAVAASTTLADDHATVRIVESTADRLVVQYEIGEYNATPITVDGQNYVGITLGQEPIMNDSGAPALPKVCRSIIIPDDAQMTVKVLSASYHELTDTNVISSKGPILRTVDPNAVPHTFGPTYTADAFYPGETVTLGEPYIMRHHRGQVVRLFPFQFNPVRHALRVYTQVTIEITRAGQGLVNVLNRRNNDLEPSLAFHRVYANHFINYASVEPYAPLNENGDMLIIAHDAWLANVQPLVDHKNAMGINTTLIGVSAVPGGNNHVAIKNHIQDAYDNSNLAFVLLVGDGTQIDTASAAGGSSDPSYALLAGGDNYPEIIVGRFSAESPGDVDTQVLRTIEYELLPATTQDWFWKGMGIASNQGPGDDGEMDNEHVDNIRTDLLAAGYSVVDQIYDPSGTAGQVTTGLNEGRGIINYCGHGSSTSWGTTGFSNSNVNSLVNDNKLPFIISVACVNGQFEGTTCFAETWLRATNGAEPTGAVGMYASSINQYWDEPMCAQDETTDLLTTEAYYSYGALCYAGSCRMMDEYGSSGADMFNTWHIFGDPSVRVGGPSGPRPPGAMSSQANTEINTQVTIALQASDDGLPDPPGALTFSIVSLPEHGTLTDPGAGAITAVPHTLTDAGSGNMVNYDPDPWYAGPDSFQFHANDGGVPPEGGDSNTATVSVTVGGPQVVHSAPLDADPGWTTSGEWAFGTPTGQGGTAHGNPDPTSGATGTSVYGVNLNGDYSITSGGPYFLTAGPFDCAGCFDAELRFMRFLNTDFQPYATATVEVSNDGTGWTQLWDNGGSEIADASWQAQSFDISAIGDGAGALWFRWSYTIGGQAYAYSGWNVDDIEIWAIVSTVPGDCDHDGDVDIYDFEVFDACFTGPNGPAGAACDVADGDGDGDVDMTDMSLFQIAFSP